jgi:hypothetical protein
MLKRNQQLIASEKPLAMKGFFRGLHEGEQRSEN